jgi:holliday junction DNA helicase RuvA
MIGKLKGIIDTIGEDFAILDVQGVGYIVFCSGRTLQKLPRPGEPAAMAIETQMREDSIRLYGFMSNEERELFRLLQSVQGVGAKVALAIQTVLDVSEVASAIARQDKAAIARAPGVGPKLAARIIVELKDKPILPGFTIGAAAQATASEGSQSATVQDALSALINLGYQRPQAAAAVAASVAALGESAAVSDLIRFGLKELAK